MHCSYLSRDNDALDTEQEDVRADGSYTRQDPPSGLRKSPSRSVSPHASLHTLEPNAPSTYKSEFTQGFNPWGTDDPYHYPIPKKDDPWDECFKLVLKFDEEMCRGWREEIDTLLVFAGLFSAAVTAFTIESYTWLQPNPLDAQVQLLQSISSQLQSLGSNSSIGVQEFSQNQFTPGASSIRVNIFWFTSLTLALISVLLGILCKQWLREYQRYEGLSAKDAFPVRHLRYEGLLGWHVPAILSSLPLLLQAALVLFFAGLIDLLWTINDLVASIVTIIVGLAMDQAASILRHGTELSPASAQLMAFQ
ncbi:hypothetical protein JR316_0009066 [Psilocybe cubensis]|uniref:Uncharacterized protein n=1 Tax=Psilocybe cubensis TaxID=181762 RepID=A0ACB8GUA7_PSICU|nr:hypothetical protein JR316_0009066 [Psilocybe cubensis]KAH9478609.1 hypothetical protein JR316_0009066 [Psilocybe cubensis]